MTADAIGEMLPMIMAIALTPLQIVGMVMVLGGKRARTAGPAFLIGWLAALTAIAAAALFLIERYGGGRTSLPLLPWLQVGLGLLLLWAALHQWRSRPRDDVEPELPKWLASFEAASPPLAFVLGAAVCLSNPKVVALAVAAMSMAGYVVLSFEQLVVVVFLFVLLASLPLIALVAAHIFGNERTHARVQGVKTFMLRNNAVILTIVLALLGATILGEGISGF